MALFPSFIAIRQAGTWSSTSIDRVKVTSGFQAQSVQISGNSRTSASLCIRAGLAVVLDLVGIRRPLFGFLRVGQLIRHANRGFVCQVYFHAVEVVQVLESCQPHWPRRTTMQRNRGDGSSRLILARFAEQKGQRRTNVTRSGGSLDTREIRENARIGESGAAKNPLTAGVSRSSDFPV